MTVVERVARAMAKCTDVEFAWEAFVDEARAAIAAMREPSDGMLEASWQATRITPPEERMRAHFTPANVSHKHKQHNRYTAMIDAALNERVEGE